MNGQTNEAINEVTPKGLRRLATPFDPSDIEWYVGVTTQDKTRGLAIPFVTNRAVQDRLDDVCGIDGWKNEYKLYRNTDIIDKDGTITGNKSSNLCGISVWSDKRGEWITKWDGAEDTDIEALKGGLSSAMKRAAVQWGIGRYLYKLNSPWVEIEKKGRNHVIKDTQTLILPSWALPGGRGYPLADESRDVKVQVVGQVYGAPSTDYQQQNQNAAPAGYQAPQGHKAAPQGNTRPLSEKQINRALAKAAAANQDLDSVTLWIEKHYGVSEIAQLNRQQYDALCDALDKVAAGTY